MYSMAKPYLSPVMYNVSLHLSRRTGVSAEVSRMENSADPDRTAHLETVGSGPTLFP